MSTKLEGGENKLISNSSGQYKFQVSGGAIWSTNNLDYYNTTIKRYVSEDSKRSLLTSQAQIDKIMRDRARETAEIKAKAKAKSNPTIKDKKIYVDDKTFQQIKTAQSEGKAVGKIGDTIYFADNKNQLAEQSLKSNSTFMASKIEAKKYIAELEKKQTQDTIKQLDEMKKQGFNIKVGVDTKGTVQFTGTQTTTPTPIKPNTNYIESVADNISGASLTSNYIQTQKEKQDFINKLTKEPIPTKKTMLELEKFEDYKKEQKKKELKEQSLSSNFIEKNIVTNRLKAIETQEKYNQQKKNYVYKDTINYQLSSQESFTPMQIQSAIDLQPEISFKALKYTIPLITYGVAEGGFGTIQFGKQLITQPVETIKQMINIPAQLKGISERIYEEPISGITSIATQFYIGGKAVKGVKNTVVKFVSGDTTKAMLSSKIASVGGKKATVRAGKISKAQMRKNSLNQAYNPAVTFNKGNTIVKLTNAELKNQFIKQRIVKIDPIGKIKSITDKGFRSGLKEQSLTTNYKTGVSSINKGSVPKASKLYPKGYGSQSVVKTQQMLKSGEFIILKQKYGKSIKPLEIAKRQPIKQPSNTITNNPSVLKQIKNTDVVTKQKEVMFTPEKRQPIIRKGFRKGQYEKLQQKLYKKYNEPYQTQPKTVSEKLDSSRFDILKPKKKTKFPTVQEPTNNQIVLPPTAKQIGGVGRYTNKGFQNSNIINANFKIIGVIKTPSSSFSFGNPFKSMLPIYNDFKLKNNTDIEKAFKNSSKFDSINKSLQENRYSQPIISKFNIDSAIKQTQKYSPISSLKLNQDYSVVSDNKEDVVFSSFKEPIKIVPPGSVKINTPFPIEPQKPQPIEFKPTSNPFNIIAGNFINSNKKVKGYNVYMKEGGKQVKANVQPLPLQEAERVGRTIADQTLSASYRVSQTKKSVPQSQRSKLINSISNPSSSKFKKSKRSIFTIEKRSNRLDTFGEIKGIQASKFIAEKKNSLNLFNGKSKSKRKKGIFGF